MIDVSGSSLDLSNLIIDNEIGLLIIIIICLLCLIWGSFIGYLIIRRF